MEVKLSRIAVPAKLEDIAPGELFTVHAREGVWTGLMAFSQTTSRTRSIILSGPPRVGYAWPSSLDATALGGVIARTPFDAVKATAPLGGEDFPASGRPTNGALAVDQEGNAWLTLDAGPNFLHVSLKSGSAGEPSGDVLYYPVWALLGVIDKSAYEIVVFRGED